MRALICMCGGLLIAALVKKGETLAQNKGGNDGDVSTESDDMGALKAVFVHFRPIITNIFRLLYVVVRPIMLLLLSHRRYGMCTSDTLCKGLVANGAAHALLAGF